VFTAPHPSSVPDEKFDPSAPLAGKKGRHIALYGQALAAQGRQSIHASPEIDRVDGGQNPHLGHELDHRFGARNRVRIGSRRGKASSGISSESRAPPARSI
jgi:hypothetical protein